MCRLLLSPAQDSIKKKIKPLVLIVDDQSVNRVVLTRLVAKLGFAACEACDGAVALEELRK